MTAYDSEAKSKMKEFDGTLLRRSHVLLNDPNSPLKIEKYGFAVKPANQFEQRELSAVLRLDSTLDLAARKTVVAWTAWEVRFDEMNHYMDHSRYHEPQGPTNKDLVKGTSTQKQFGVCLRRKNAEELAKWTTTVLYVESARTADGIIWTFNQEKLTQQFKNLALQLPESYSFDKI